MIDTHCHLTYDGLRDRLDEVLAYAKTRGVTGMVSVGTAPDDSALAVELASACNAKRDETGVSVWTTAGLHPLHSDEVTDLPAMVDALRNTLDKPGVVALGEMGLDQHYPEPALEIQIPAFEAQLELAAEREGLPVVIHNRKATDRTLSILRSSGLPGDRFLFHCFTGSPEEARAILDFGAWLGFTGIVTFKSARDVAEASDLVPRDRLMIETDSPYLTPEPHRKVRPNEPGYVADVAAFLANRRGETLHAFTEQTDANARRFYGLDAPR